MFLTISFYDCCHCCSAKENINEKNTYPNVGTDPEIGRKINIVPKDDISEHDVKYDRVEIPKQEAEEEKVENSLEEMNRSKDKKNGMIPISEEDNNVKEHYSKYDEIDLSIPEEARALVKNLLEELTSGKNKKIDMIPMSEKDKKSGSLFFNTFNFFNTLKSKYNVITIKNLRNNNELIIQTCTSGNLQIYYVYKDVDTWKVVRSIKFDKNNVQNVLYMDDLMTFSMNYIRYSENNSYSNYSKRDKLTKYLLENINNFEGRKVYYGSDKKASSPGKFVLLQPERAAGDHGTKVIESGGGMVIL